MREREELHERPEDAEPREDAARREEAEPREGTREPVPGIRHEPEPDGENIIPAKDQPGTL